MTRTATHLHFNVTRYTFDGTTVTDHGPDEDDLTGDNRNRFTFEDSAFKTFTFYARRSVAVRDFTHAMEALDYGFEPWWVQRMTWILTKMLSTAA